MIIRIFISAALVLCVSSSYGQTAQPEYKSFSHFQGDTLAYMRYNYGLDMIAIGHDVAMSVFFNKFELPIKSFKVRIVNNKIIGVTFYVRPADTIRQMEKLATANYAILLPLVWNNWKSATPLISAINGLEDNKITEWNDSYKSLFNSMKIQYAYHQEIRN